MIASTVKLCGLSENYRDASLIEHLWIYAQNRNRDENLHFFVTFLFFLKKSQFSKRFFHAPTYRCRKSSNSGMLGSVSFPVFFTCFADNASSSLQKRCEMENPYIHTFFYHIYMYSLLSNNTIGENSRSYNGINYNGNISVMYTLQP